jgi:hypothetical protein
MNLRYLPVAVLILLAKTLHAQHIVPSWAHGADDNDFSAGFSFHYVNPEFKINKTPDWRSPFYDPATGVKLTDSLQSISSKTSPGFGIGFFGRYRLSEHLEVRFAPTLVFTDRLLEYEYKNAAGNPLLTSKTTNVLEQQVQTALWDFPLALKIKSDRLGNFRAYLVGGVKYSLLMGAKKNAENASPVDKLVRNVSGYAAYEAGIGFDIYFEYFKLSPEFKMSNSFKNVLVPENHPYSRPIDKLFLHTIMFSLYFE